MHRNLLSLLVLCILVASIVVGCSQPCALTIFTVTGGDVSVMKAGADEWIEAEVGMSLQPGDAVVCGDNSSAEITFVDGSAIELQVGTEIEVDSLGITETGSATIVVKQAIGSIIFRVTKIIDPASRYEVETPGGVVAIRGSVAQIYVTEDGTTRAINLEGDVWAIAQGVELKVPEGQQCIIRPDQPPELMAEVTFADPNLEAAVRDAIAIPTAPIYSSDLGRLTHLDASQKNITDLTGLEWATSLTQLILEFNSINDISPLANLSNLTYLNLHSNQISDLSPFANLTELTLLFLSDNQINDISPLTNLSNLIQLILWDNQISDISALASLTRLTLLLLDYNQIVDISALANLTEVTSLSLSGNQISNISALANLTSLTKLYLQVDQINDISALANLNNLTELSLWGNEIGDISALANLTSLTLLDLEENQIVDISPLLDNDGLSEGDEVYVQGNPLSSESVNIHIPELEARGVSVDY